ncbi:MAG: zinc ribbon domain-containing protein [Candidatus Melainabacteria bacterium]|nr:zinc ribbon domain-containing protein [Candidatus Melainabacteria bacterium]
MPTLAFGFNGPATDNRQAEVAKPNATPSIGETFQQLGQLLRAVFRCRHTHAPLQEGKCYCPDCGTALIHRWVQVRCAHCQAKRPALFLFAQLIPALKVCTQCGHTAIRVETLENPAHYQLQQAVLVWEEEAHYLKNQQGIPPWVQRCRVWLETEAAFIPRALLKP